MLNKRTENFVFYLNLILWLRVIVLFSGTHLEHT